MPVRYVCRRCGYVLWEFKHVGQDCYGLPTPTEVMNVYGGICPRCKRELRKPGLDDIIIDDRTRSNTLLSKKFIGSRGVQEAISVSSMKDTSYSVEA